MAKQILIHGNLAGKPVIVAIKFRHGIFRGSELLSFKSTLRIIHFTLRKQITLFNVGHLIFHRGVFMH